MGRVVSPTPTPLSSGRVVPALVASYDMHGRAVGLFYTQPTGQNSWTTVYIKSSVTSLRSAYTVPENSNGLVKIGLSSDFFNLMHERIHQTYQEETVIVPPSHYSHHLTMTPVHVTAIQQYPHLTVPSSHNTIIISLSNYHNPRSGKKLSPRSCPLTIAAFKSAFSHLEQHVNTPLLATSFMGTTLAFVLLVKRGFNLWVMR